MTKKVINLVASIILLLVPFNAYASTNSSLTAAPVGGENASLIAIDDPNSKEAVRELVAKLSDTDVRELLIQRLDAVTENNLLENDRVLDVVSKGFAAYWGNAVSAVSETHLISTAIDGISKVIAKNIEREGGQHILFILILALVFGGCAERSIAFLFRNKKRQLIDEVSTKLSGILRIIYTRLAIDIAGVMAFTLASYAVIAANYSNGTLLNQLIYIVTVTLTAFGLSYVICRFFFAPKRPEIRICQTSDQRAQRLTMSFSILASYIVLLHSVFVLLLQIGVENFGGYNYMIQLGFYLNLSMYLFASLTIWYNRQGLTDVLLNNKKRVTQAIGEKTEYIDSWFATHWPKIAIVLIISKYFLVEVIINSSDVGVYSAGAVYMTFIVIFLWPGVDATVSLFVWKSVDVPDSETVAAGKSRRSMQQGLLRSGRTFVVGGVLFVLASLWGLRILDLAQSGLGAQLAGNLVEILLVLLLSYFSWEFISIFVDRWLTLEGGESSEDVGTEEIGGVGLSRVATILPIVRKTARFVIVVITIVMILDNLGVNIAPILAGAGVLGLAIGFGAQTLVKDIVSGMFFLADDAFRVGEYIDVGGTMGTVEKISLRSLRLRHHRGLVHTIPYGEIPKLTNYSRDWVIMKLRFRVPFDTDIKQIKKIFKKIGKSLLEDPELGKDFLQPFKSQGVAEVDDNGIVIRGKFMAKPGKQFMIRKEVYVRVQKAFEEANIPFARKQVMVHIPGLENLEALRNNDLKAISAAAAESVEEPAVSTQKL